MEEILQEIEYRPDPDHHEQASEEHPHKVGVLARADPVEPREHTPVKFAWLGQWALLDGQHRDRHDNDLYQRNHTIGNDQLILICIKIGVAADEIADDDDPAHGA